MTMQSIGADALGAAIGRPDAPLIFDVCRAEKFCAHERVIAGARWRDHMMTDTWGPQVPAGAEVVVYCVHGHNVSQLAAARLRNLGVRARHLDGGIEHYLSLGHPSVLRRPHPHGATDRASRWVTAPGGGVDRLACCWFIRRFLDPAAAFHVVEGEWVADVAEELEAAAFGCRDALPDLGAMIAHYSIEVDALHEVAGALSRPEAGIAAILAGLACLYKDDRVLMAQAMPVFDGLYAEAQAVASRAAA